MNASFIILFITAILLYNTYHDNFIIKTFTCYQKYYKMGLIFVLGVGFYILIQKNPLQGMSAVQTLNQYINVLPIDKNAKNFIIPFLSSENKSIQRIMQSSKSTKRSVSETKKKL